MKKLLFFALCVCGLGDFAFSQEAKIFHFGDVEFVALKDKDTNMGKAILLTPDAPVVKKVMKDDQNPSSINAFLVKFKGQNALIDTGVGGELMSALKSVGVGANDVDIVLLTHMHGDHIAGLLDADKKRAFKKAKVFVHEKELSYWLNNQSAKKENADLVKAVKAAYGADLLTFKWDDYIELTEKCRQLCEAPQFRQPIKLINAEGHTPGHTAFEIDNGGEKILVVGDIVHSFAVQLADPNMSVVFDIDPKMAAKSRIRLFDYASANNITIAGMHIRFSGVGKLGKKGGEYWF